MLAEYTMRLHGIRFRTNVGASRSERAIPQELVVDVDLYLPLSALPEHDDRKEVVDYDAVSRMVVEEGTSATYRVLEMYVQRVVTRLLAETPAERVRVAVTKRRVPTLHSVDKAIVELLASRDPK
jgi:FolB domain-containing protein